MTRRSGSFSPAIAGGYVGLRRSLSAGRFLCATGYVACPQRVTHVQRRMFLDVRQCEIDGRHVTLVGTRVLTLEALEEISVLFDKLRPSTVVLDYDATRWRWLDVLAGDGDVDLVQVIKSGQMSELNSRLAMGVLAKSVAPRAGVAEDAEFVRAHAAATTVGANIVFGRRPVDVEGLRAWRHCTVGGRGQVAWRLMKGSLRRTQLDPALVDVSAFDAPAARIEAVERAGQAAPVVFDEAARWIAEQTRRAGDDALVFTHAASLDAIERALQEDVGVEGLNIVPQKSLFSRVVPWAFTGLIIAAFVLGFVFADPAKMEQAMVAWFASNMSFAALGALLALAHPVTIIATSISAPFVSLNPAVGAGMVGALVQAFVAPPTVHDMDRVGDDITRITGWWRNRLARLVLIFIFGNLFSSIGSFAAFAWFPTS